jgi:hypothetical protein
MVSVGKAMLADEVVMFVSPVVSEEKYNQALVCGE